MADDVAINGVFGKAFREIITQEELSSYDIDYDFTYPDNKEK